MRHLISTLLAAAALTAVIGVASAEEHGTAPEILTAINDSSYHPLSNAEMHKVVATAGPFFLAPGQKQSGISTFLLGNTTVHVTNGSNNQPGQITMKTVISPPDVNEVPPGPNAVNFSRSFGGFPLTISNTGQTTLTTQTLAGSPAF